MFNRKTVLVSTFILGASLILAACGTSAVTDPATPEPAAPTASQAAPTQPAGPAPTETPTEIPPEAPTGAPTGSTSALPAGTVSFAKDVMPIIDSRCVNCHGGERIEEGLVLTDYASLMAGSENGPVIMPGDPANSLLVELIANRKMPKRGPKLTPPQVQIISDWVAAGAQNN